ncbi:MAG TPA: class I SAM-dependent methyltransferase [Thermoanaerobaculia bacterium]|nr:class I SAM-dependent methyltransferase [Thermoanaerobaculia bacterium]
MATQRQIAGTYDYMDRFFRLVLGEYGDCSGAFYDGDFSKTLEQAQRAKHDYALDSLGCAAGSRMLDIGCGWGPMLNAIRVRGGHGVGYTLSPQQAASCRRHGLEVYLADWKELRGEELGRFDGVVSLGAFEHFCSREEYEAGQQAEIYGRFFELCGGVLQTGGRLFLQTMTWGEAAPRCEDVSLDAPKDSNAYVVALLSKFYPGSWLPYGLEQIARSAGPYFRLVSSNNGRRDYIETIDQWNRKINPFSLPKLIEMLRLVPAYAGDSEFRWKVKSLTRYGGCNRECFVRRIMEHERIVFERT